MTNPVKIISAVIVLGLITYGLFVFDVPYKTRVDDFATCVAAGNPVMESYPRQCRDAKTNMLYVEEVPQATSTDMIRVTSPVGGASVGSPFEARGEARGNWFFEASFPIEVRSTDGLVLGQGFAQALGEWMTTEFVPWTATVSFDSKGRTEGVVRFMKDNPSGLPQHDAYIDVPVKFKTTGTGTLPACRVGGCSSHICSDDESIVTTCEWKPEYACYRTAKCERQANGLCGWTVTTTLNACLANPPQE